MIVFLCTHCGAQLRLKPDKAVTAGRCPRCRRTVEVPQDGKPAAESRDSGREEFETAFGIKEGDIDFLRPPEQPGELGRLGDYRVLRVLGTGAMGIVFEAEDVKLFRRVALKVMKKDQARAPGAADRFLAEARATAQIEHDNIVTIYQVGDDRDVPFLAMKLLVGESLEERLNRAGPLPPEEVVRIGSEIAEGLAAAHERGLIHRDIKPANIWLEEGRDRVKIVDFGLARVADDLSAELAERNYLIGTPLYMSPEQARGGADLTPKSDLFSLGSLLYRTSTGELPFKGATARAVLLAVLRDAPMPPRYVNPKVPTFLSRLIMDLLEKSPADRPRTARIVVASLEEARTRLAEEPEPEPVEPEPEDDEPVEADPEPSAPRPRRPRRPRRKGQEPASLEARVIRFAIIAGVLVFLLLAFLVIKNTFFRSRDDDPPAPKGRAEPGVGHRAQTGPTRRKEQMQPPPTRDLRADHT